MKAIKPIFTLQFLYWGAGGIVILLLIWSMLSIPTPELKGSHAGDSTNPVHWHIPISLDICGKKMDMPEGEGKHGLVHGHKDKQLHVEGQIFKTKDVRLTKYFESVNIPFSSTQVSNLKNGDTCKGSSSPGKVTLLVNGVENFDFENYILKDGDEIVVSFE